MAQIIGDGITFDDVLLVPGYSQVIPNQVDLSTNLTKTIKLNIPMMSASYKTNCFAHSGTSSIYCLKTGLVNLLIIPFYVSLCA